MDMTGPYAQREETHAKKEQTSTLDPWLVIQLMYLRFLGVPLVRKHLRRHPARCYSKEDFTM